MRYPFTKYKSIQIDFLDGSATQRFDAYDWYTSRFTKDFYIITHNEGTNFIYPKKLIKRIIESRVDPILGQ